MLALLVWTGSVNVWFIFALSFVAGCGQAFGGPAYQALIPSLVPRRDLPNAIALNSSQFNLSRVLGPGAGVAIVSTIGLAACFAVNALSFFFVVLALASLHLPPHMPSPDRRALGAELQSGLFFVRDHFPTGGGNSHPYGPFAFGLSGHSDVYLQFGTGDGRIAIHGTNQPSSIGAAASNGCPHVPNDVVLALIPYMPLGTPVVISP